MRSISLAKPLIIMMVGLPGSGKSFFAKQFSDTFGAPVVSLDRVYYELSEDRSFEDVYEKAQRIIGYQIMEFVKTKKTFIIDGGVSSRAERQAVKKVAIKNGYDTMVIWVQTDISTCQMRSLKRSPKKSDDEFNRPLDIESFRILSKNVSAPAPQEKFVVVSGKHTYNTQVRIVLRKLATPRETQSEQATETPRVPLTAPIPAPVRNISISSAPAVPPRHDPPPSPPPRQNVKIN